jgi:hypothetical protein
MFGVSKNPVPRMDSGSFKMATLRAWSDWRSLWHVKGIYAILCDFQKKGCHGKPPDL